MVNGEMRDCSEKMLIDVYLNGRGPNWSDS